MRIELTRNERLAILSVVSVWEPQQITQEVFRALQHEWGVPAQLVETTFWHVDTLAALAGADWLVFKGGTCVQSYLDPGYQRASVDLDFNATLANPHSIMAAVDRLNMELRDKGGHVRVRGVDFGLLEFKGEDLPSGTLNYARRLPSRFGELERVGDVTLQAKSLRVQINYRHAWLPALRVVEKEPVFFIFTRQQPQKKVTVAHSSPEDLLADKVLALSNVGPFGRQRFKDLYDAGMLCTLQPEAGVVREKLELVGRKALVDPQAILAGAVNQASVFATRAQEARGFAAMVARQGREALRDWEGFCEGTARNLEAFGP